MVKKIFALLVVLTFFVSMGVFATDSAPSEEMVSQAETELEELIRARKSDVVFLHIGNYATVSNGTLTWIDRDNKNVKPYIKEGRTMVPLRFITEEMGATVGYHEETAGITVTLGDIVMELTVGEKAYSVNGEAFEMDCAAEIFEDRTFVPVRFVSESLGRAVEWLDVERIVVITPLASPWEKENSLERAVLAEVQLMLSPLVRDKIQ